MYRLTDSLTDWPTDRPSVHLSACHCTALLIWWENHLQPVSFWSWSWPAIRKLLTLTLWCATDLEFICNRHVIKFDNDDDAGGDGDGDGDGVWQKWMDILSRKSRKPPSCELCQYQFRRHKHLKVNYLCVNPNPSLLLVLAAFMPTPTYHCCCWCWLLSCQPQPITAGAGAGCFHANPNPSLLVLVLAASMVWYSRV